MFAGLPVGTVVGIFSTIDAAERYAHFGLYDRTPRRATAGRRRPVS